MELAPYTYDLSDPSTWRNFKAPPRDESFDRALLEVGGLNRYGRPNLRMVWGDSERVYVKASQSDDFKTGWYLKYHRCFVRRPKGFQFGDPLTKKRREVRSLFEIPEGVSFITPLFDMEELGTPRWVVEIWRDEGDFGGAIGKSAYYPLLTIQGEPVDPVTNMGPYRPPGEDVLEILRGVFRFDERPEAERDALLGEQVEREAKAAEAKRAAVWEDARDEWARIVRDNQLL